MIQALPPEVRAEYENLEGDTLLFYPRKLVADGGPEFDALVEKYRSGVSPWAASIEMGGPDDPVRQLVERRTDHDDVSIQLPIGRLVRTLQERRRGAKKEYGPGSAAEKGYKEAANSIFGVMASGHLVTNNVVAANVVTATARAIAFAMQLGLNRLQVITDGCGYRRDQIPAGDARRLPRGDRVRIPAEPRELRRPVPGP